MSWCLVGSEMCIRDRAPSTHPLPGVAIDTELIIFLSI
jgi:hypothetical protein